MVCKDVVTIHIRCLTCFLLAIRVTMTAINVAKQVENRRVKRGTTIPSNEYLPLRTSATVGTGVLPENMHTHKEGII